jgi:hypothetical protein
MSRDDKREHPHDARARKARADLERLQTQSEKLLGAPEVGTRPPVDENDPIERWGRRIGLFLGVCALIWVVHDLLTTYIFTQ